MENSDRPRLTVTRQASDDGVFDRQKRIPDWPQEAIETARILVIGAGAIGNEVIKNLMLIGARNLLICDFDHIEPSNLSRTVLFREEDIGKAKAEVAAERARQMALSSAAKVEAFHGDVVWDLGLGEIGSYDLILGCLDNVEARRAMNRASRLLGVAYVDAGIMELNASVTVFGGGEEDACYECSLSDQARTASRARYSCHQTKRVYVESRRIPTVQISAAVCAGLQVQEAVRLLAGDRSSVGRKVSWLGPALTLRNVSMTQDPSCLAHATYDALVALPASASGTLQELLDLAENTFGDGPYTLDISSDRDFITSAGCRACGRPIRLMRPLHRLTDDDLLCGSTSARTCTAHGDEVEELIASEPAKLQHVSRFSRTATPELLSFRLSELGVPKRHIVTFVSPDGRERHVRLDGDPSRLSETPGDTAQIAATQACSTAEEIAHV